jgi:hypothetical protein
MALPNNADVVVVHGYWLDETSGRGVRQENGRPALITFEPVPLAGQSVTRTPNLRDTTASTFVKTRVRTAAVDSDTGYFAIIVVSSNDPDLDAYAGRKVTMGDEEPFTIQVPYNSLLTTVSQQMADKTGLTLNTQVRAIWLLDAALVTMPPPVPPINYLTSVQTLSTLASGIVVHNGDLTSHPDLRQIIANNAATAQSNLTAHTSRTDNPHSVTKAQVGLGNADNTSDVNKPVSTAQQTALDTKLAKASNLSDLTNIGLGNVNNTSDVNKPVSTAQAAADALNLKIAQNLADLNNATTARTNIGLGNVDNTSDVNKPISTATQTALNGKSNTGHTHPASDLTATGTQNATTFLRGDNTWDVLRGTAVVGDASVTLTATSAPVQFFNTALTAARTVTLPTTGNSDGDVFRIVRTSAASGSFNLNIGSGPVKALTAASTWCDVTWVGSLAVWTTSAAGSL